MSPVKKILRQSSFMALFVLLVVACGGGEAAPTSTSPPLTTATTVAVLPEPTATAVPPPSATDVPTPAASPTPSATETPAPTLKPVARKANVEIRVTDAPPEGVTKILLTVSQIDVHRGGSSDDAGWQTVVAGPVEFDLVQVTGVEEILGDKELDPERYDQVRLNVDEAEVTFEDGRVVDAKVPSGRLKIVGGFTLEEGKTTILTLDFDADKSVVVAGTKNVLIKPVIKLLVRDKDTTLAEASQVGEIQEQDLPTTIPTETPVPTLTPAPSPTPTQTPTPAPPPLSPPSPPQPQPPPDSGSAPPATSTTTDLLVSGFVPAVGQGDPPPGTSGSGPWATRIMLASSTDGLTFTRTGEIVADQGGVPNMIVDHDGRVRVYYVAWQQTGNVGGSDGNFTAVAIRTAPGEWVYHRVRIEGISSPTPPVDPDAVLLQDSRYRLYFKLDASISSATSTNGVDFILDEGERFATDEPVFDPAVLETDSGWQMWIGPDGSYTASSVDGLEFTPTGAFTVQGQSFHPWSAVAVSGGGYRLYGSHLSPGSSGGISSVFSQTGETWQLDTGSRLSETGLNPALEAGFEVDNGVAVLADGSYLLAYLATIP